MNDMYTAVCDQFRIINLLIPKATIDRPTSQLAFYLNLYRAVIGPTGLLSGQ